MDITPSSQDIAPHTNNAVENFKHLLGGVHFRFPSFNHDHPEIIDVNKTAEEQMTMGQKIADKVAATVGSWPFILTQSFILLCWLVLNSIAWADRWDPYPFILLNLALSFQAAYAAPFVMMSQNRQAEKDRLTAQNDYTTDVKGELEICHIMEHLDHQDTLILKIIERLETQHGEMLQHLRVLDPEYAKKFTGDFSINALKTDENVGRNS